MFMHGRKKHVREMNGNIYNIKKEQEKPYDDKMRKLLREMLIDYTEDNLEC